MDHLLSPFSRSMLGRRKPALDLDAFDDDSTTPGFFPKDPLKRKEASGICDASYSASRRRMLDLINRLHSTGYVFSRSMLML